MNPAYTAIKSLAFVAISLAAGLMSTSAQALSDKAQQMVGTAPEGKALVVFFRPKKFVGSAVGFKVREDSVELGKLRNGRYFTVAVEPGAHVYQVHSEAKDLLNLEVAAGETHFVRGGLSMGIMAGRPNLSPSTPEEFDDVHKKLKPAKPLKS